MSRVEDAYRRMRRLQPDDSAGDERDRSTPYGPERYPREHDVAPGPVNGVTIPGRELVPGLDGDDSGRSERSFARSRRDDIIAPDRGRQRSDDNWSKPPSHATFRDDVSNEQTSGQSAVNPSTLIWGFARVLMRRKLLILSAFVVVATASALFLRTVTPVFRATARLTVDTRTQADALLKTPADGGTPQGSLDALAEGLRNRALAEATATKLVLWQQPDYAPIAGGAPSADGPAPDRVVDRFMANTTIATVPLSSVIAVSVQSTEPQAAAMAANSLAQGFTDRDLESRLAGAKDANAWIGRQLEEQRTRVTETETALQRYREAQNASSLDDRQNMVVQRLGDLNTAVTRARTERIGREELYKRVTELQQSKELLESVPAVAGNAYIQQLKGQIDLLDRQLSDASATLGERHPEIIRLTNARAETSRRLETEISTVAASVRNEFLTAQSEEQSLTAALDVQKREAQQLDRKGVEYAALWREAESNRALYQNLLEQAKHLGLSSDLQRSNIRILDRATPPREPINPVGLTGLLLALLSSAALAIGLGLVVEYFDPRLRTLEEVSEQLRLPLLGFLEVLDADGAGGRRLDPNMVPARFKEQVGRIRASIESEMGSQGGVLLIASAEPKEGKTFVATNLALAFAQAGRRVLVVDCDLRRSQVHAAFNVPVEPGLTTICGPDRKTLAATVHPGPSPKLSILAAGSPRASPAELLGGPAFMDLLAEARVTYDWIIIDSPPVMVVSDAHVLARLVDDVVFVASADQTRRHAATLAVAQLRRSRARIVGTVLNRVALPRWRAFGSSHYGGGYDYYSDTGDQS